MGKSRALFIVGSWKNSVAYEKTVALPRSCEMSERLMLSARTAAVSVKPPATVIGTALTRVPALAAVTGGIQMHGMGREGDAVRFADYMDLKKRQKFSEIFVKNHSFSAPFPKVNIGKNREKSFLDRKEKFPATIKGRIRKDFPSLIVGFSYFYLVGFFWVLLIGIIFDYYLLISPKAYLVEKIFVPRFFHKKNWKPFYENVLEPPTAETFVAGVDSRVFKSLCKKWEKKRPLKKEKTSLNSSFNSFRKSSFLSRKNFSLFFPIFTFCKKGAEKLLFVKNEFAKRFFPLSPFARAMDYPAHRAGDGST